jgi:FkbM family methyltransferase
MLKTAIQHLGRYGLHSASSILRRIQAFTRDPYLQVCYSQEGEDLVLKRFLPVEEEGYYVDVGAHHPWKYSNTNLFYRAGWSGINIEPNPEVAPLFSRHRPRDISLQMGVSESSGSLTYHYFDEPALNTFDARLAEDRQRSTGYRLLRTQIIPVQRLDAILDKHLPAGRRISFLSVDVEGLDLAVLRSNDWERYRPRFVLAEELDAAMAQPGSGEISQYMVSKRYRLVAKTYNTQIYMDCEA